MNTNGMMFGMEGPMVNGWWVNPKTGDKFNAIDTYFEDNQLIVKTSDGRMIHFNQMQNYIKAKPDEVERISESAKNKQNKQSIDYIPDEILNEIEQPGNSNSNINDITIPDDNIYTKPLGNMYAKGNNQSIIQDAVKNKDFEIIDRALNSKSLPSLTPSVCWKDMPSKEIDMLIDMLGVSEDEIVEYYLNKISIDDLYKSCQEQITEYIKQFSKTPDISVKSETPLISKTVEKDKKETVKKKKK